MGCNFVMSRGGDPSPPSGNPNPRNFIILDEYTLGDDKIFAIKVQYPDAKNYEGLKILVYKNNSLSKLKTLKILDPHFSDDGSPSPYARFEPTESGWESAMKLVLTLTIATL